MLDSVEASRERARACRRQVRNTTVLQRYARGYLARRHARTLRAHRDHMRAFLAEQAAAAALAAEQARKREIERRMHPRSARDFETLYNELEAWRRQETRRIEEAGHTPAARKAAFEALLHKVRRRRRHACAAVPIVRYSGCLRGWGPRCLPRLCIARRQVAVCALRALCAACPFLLRLLRCDASYC